MAATQASLHYFYFFVRAYNQNSTSFLVSGNHIKPLWFGKFLHELVE